MSEIPLVIVGAGGFGREVAWLVQDINHQDPRWKLIGFVDDNKTVYTIEGYPIIGNIEQLIMMEPKPNVVLAIADSVARKRLTNILGMAGFNFATLVHPSVSKSEHVLIGEGSIICSGSILTTNIKIGRFCIINPGCFIGHDTVLEDYVSLMPGVSIAGDVKIEEGTYIGLNACVINQKKVGKWSVIGAGAVVTTNISHCVTAVGVPAKVIKNRVSELEGE